MRKCLSLTVLENVTIIPIGDCSKDKIHDTINNLKIKINECQDTQLDSLITLMIKLGYEIHKRYPIHQ